MFDQINYLLILGAALLAVASPGPSTLAIAGTAMAQGRSQALALVAGISTGSWTWSIAAALGLSALMQANAWIFELLRYLGAGYLLYLGYRSARKALAGTQTTFRSVSSASPRRAYGKGLAMHLTNPKAILFFVALYSVGVPASATAPEIASVVLVVGVQSMLVFSTYAFLFSRPRVAAIYVRLTRWFETAFALAFGFAGIKLLTARLM